MHPAGELAQLARALAWHARGHEFDSRILHNRLPFMVVFFLLKPELYLPISANRDSSTPHSGLSGLINPFPELRRRFLADDDLVGQIGKGQVHFEFDLLVGFKPFDVVYMDDVLPVHPKE